MNEILVKPTSIKRVKSSKPVKFYDLTVNNEFHEFFIIANDTFLYYTHNCDGGHIATLLTNLFYRWFPYIVNEGRLFRLQVPLLSTGDGKKREYYYGMQEYHDAKAPKSVRYLKGLGSLSIDDWEHVMENKRLEQLSAGDNADEYLKMAFDTDSGPRKLWLQGKPF